MQKVYLLTESWGSYDESDYKNVCVSFEKMELDKRADEHNLKQKHKVYSFERTYMNVEELELI